MGNVVPYGDFSRRKSLVLFIFVVPCGKVGLGPVDVGEYSIDRSAPNPKSGVYAQTLGIYNNEQNQYDMRDSLGTFLFQSFQNPLNRSAASWV